LSSALADRLTEPRIITMHQPEIEQIGEESYFVAASPATRRLRTQAELLSQTDVPVLITGEAGSGKATTAHLIHSLSIRSSFEFVRVSCAALTADLLESELFGYEIANGNGRLEAKPGKFEQCAKGTVLLEDFDTMPMPVQVRLLRLLQSREFTRFGGQSAVRAEVRIIASAQEQLELAVAEKRVHEELYYHLSAFGLHVPPLRERREEIPLLLGHFMNRLTRRYGVPAPHFSSALRDACQQHSWPGNLRELEIFVKRFLVFGDESAAIEELRSHPRLESGSALGNGNGHESVRNGHTSGEEKASLKLLVRNAKGEAERSAIAHALEETHWNRKAAARLLSISYRALLYKIQEYRLVPPPDLHRLYGYSVREAK
jgi:two-component system response regulator AtoC